MTPFHGLCFSIGDTPKDAAQFRPFLELVRPALTWGVRTYNTFSLPGIGAAAHDLGLKLAGGAWLDTNLARNRTEIDRLIEAARAGEVDLAVIGNETLFRNDLTAAELIAYVRTFKAAVPDVPVTTGEVADRLIEHPEVIEAVDLVGMHHYPYWCGVPIESAFSHMTDLYAKVKALADARGKAVWILETGWPSDGNAKGDAIPSPANAARYFREIIGWSRADGPPVFYFEAFDEPWKQRDEGPQGAHWGVWTQVGDPKYLGA